MLIPPVTRNPDPRPSPFERRPCPRCKRDQGTLAGRFPVDIAGNLHWKTICGDCHRKTQRDRNDRRKRLQERQAGKPFTKADIAALLERQSARCLYCGIDIRHTATKDHYIPLYLGGRHGLENLVLACIICNDTKSRHHPRDWIPDAPRTAFLAISRYRKTGPLKPALAAPHDPGGPS